MALFTKKSKKEEKITDKTTVTIATSRNLENIIRKPRITEKAVVNADVARAYTFEVDENATKNDVKEAVEKIYKVTPVKVNMTIIPRKAVGIRRGKGFKKGGKKAVVFLKKGDKIDFV